MSIILEALKKAEQERQNPPPTTPPAAAPTLQQVLAKPLPSRSRNAGPPWPLIIGGGSAVLALVLGLVWWKMAPRNAAPPSPAVSAATPANTAPVAAEDAGAAAETLDDLIAAEEPEAESAIEVPAGSAPKVEPNTDEPDEVATAEPETAVAAPRATQKPPTPSAVDATEEAEIAAAELAELKAPVKPKPAPERKATKLRDMPSSYRTTFPALAVQVHNYDDNPLRRFAIINGFLYRESDVLKEGPRVIEITPEGVVLEKDGTRVMKSLPR